METPFGLQSKCTRRFFSSYYIYYVLVILLVLLLIGLPGTESKGELSTCQILCWILLLVLSEVRLHWCKRGPEDSGVHCWLPSVLWGEIHEDSVQLRNSGGKSHITASDSAQQLGITGLCIKLPAGWYAKPGIYFFIICRCWWSLIFESVFSG